MKRSNFRNYVHVLTAGCAIISHIFNYILCLTGKPLFPGFPPAAVSGVPGGGEFDLARHQQQLLAAAAAGIPASTLLESSSSIKIPTAHRPGGLPGPPLPPPGSSPMPSIPGAASPSHIAAAQQAQAAAQAQFDLSLIHI